VTRRPGSFRKKTLQEAWDNAPDGSGGGKSCPTCDREINVRPGEKGNRRDWDADHQPPWSKRDLSGKTRKEVLDEYNDGVRLECPSCNRSRGAEPAK
jgi:filamentous hemagglutinin